MELFAIVGFLVIIACVVIAVNLYRRPDWTKRKLGSLADRLKGKP